MEELYDTTSPNFVASDKENSENSLSEVEVGAPCLEKVLNLRKINPNNVMFGFLNINSLRNKFSDLRSMIQGKFDIFTVGETKIDASFPDAQFFMEGYTRPYRKDVSAHSGGLITYVNSDIPSHLKTDFSVPADLQVIPIELNLRKTKWLVVSIYRPPKQALDYFIRELSVMLDFYSSKYQNMLVMGDFNVEPGDVQFNSFLQQHGFHNHINAKTCWKSPTGSCIDLLLSNRKHSFKHSGVAETGLSDHHSMIYSMLKTTFIKSNPRKFIYRNLKNFQEDRFLCELNEKLKDLSSYSQFHQIFFGCFTKTCSHQN